jgi:hypothetical protein
METYPQTVIRVIQFLIQFATIYSYLCEFKFSSLVTIKTKYETDQLSSMIAYCSIQNGFRFQDNNTIKTIANVTLKLKTEKLTKSYYYD